MAQLIRINANVEWRIARDPLTEHWVGACDALRVTAEADTWGQLCQRIEEIHNELFRDLLGEGELEQFLRQHGWQPLTPVPRDRDANVVFDIPAHLIPAPAYDQARSLHQ